MTIESTLHALQPSLVAMRRDFHQHPELGFEEHRTSERLAQHLEALGLTVQRGVGKTGVVARLQGAKPGRTVLLRADMDALPIHEATGAAYSSQTPNVMHACGHDGHSAVLAHVASALVANKHELAGQYVFCFQPAEETVGGAKPMIQDGVMQGVERVVGLHLWNSEAVGWVGVRAGPVMAAPDSFAIRIVGKGGHAASPHLTVDPIVVGAHLVTALQTLASRETNPIQTSVVTIATLQAGEGAFNVIPQTALLKGTLRTFDADLRAKLEGRIKDLSVQLCAAFGASAEIEWIAGPPPVVNDVALTQVFTGVANALGHEVTSAEPTMGGEDMAEYLALKPGVFFFVGSNDPATGRDKPHHHPGFDFDDEKALPIAARLLAETAIAFASSETP